VSGGAVGPDLVLATRNPGKAREIASIYVHLGIVWRFLADMPEIGDVPEDEASYAENAAAKARLVAVTAGLPALGDDSGVEIDALGGTPGIHSARFLGGRATDAERCARILQDLGDVPDSRRTARYVAAVAVALPNGSVRVFEATCEGSIARAPRGAGGFGYDPIFLPDGDTRTMAEMPVEIKNRISHRARALRAAEPYVLEVLRLRRKERLAGSAK